MDGGARRTMQCAFDVRELPGRGRGMVAIRDISRGEKLARFESYGFTLYDDGPTSEYPAGKSTSHSQTCSLCLRWSRHGCDLSNRCEGCGEGYCSLACKAAAQDHGHKICCAALARMAQVDQKKYSQYERATACFLLRAFARRRSEEKRVPRLRARSGAVQCEQGEPDRQENRHDAHSSQHDSIPHRQEDTPQLEAQPAPAHQAPLASGEWLIAPTFAWALFQQADHAADEKRRNTIERTIKLARLQKASLVDEADARTLLNAEPCNAFHLFDPDEVVRGSINYPQASMFNHSCLPNCAALAVDSSLEFEALVDIPAGEELTYCYLRSFALGSEETHEPWGFSCICTRCTGTASATQLAAFDAEWRCACGKIVVSAKAHLAQRTGICHCHSQNRISAQP
jgi:hypothetical protein